MGRRRGLLSAILLRVVWPALAVLVGAVEGSAQEIVVVTPQTSRMELLGHTSVLRDPGGGLTWEEVREKAGEFGPVGWGRGGFGFTADAVWLRVVLKGEVPEPTSCWIELGCPRLGEVDWYVVGSDGRLRQAERTGILRPKSPSLPMTRNPVLPVTLHPDEELEVYVRARSQTALILPLTLWSPGELAGTNGRRALVDGLFFGYLFGMGIVAIGMALMTKERGVLLYALLLPIVGGLYFFAGGYPSWYGWPESEVWERDAVLVLHVLVWFLVILFVRYLSDLPRRAPRLDRWAKGALWGCGVLMTAGPFLPYRPMIVGILSCEVGMFLGSLIGSFYLWRRGWFKGGRILMAGILSSYLVGTLSIMQYLRLIPIVIRPESQAMVVICMCTGFFMVALSVRVREIRLESERNQRRALQAQEEINQRLEAEVRERTAELRLAKEHAEEANRFKSLFLANISHEVRAPISALVGLSQALSMQSEKQGLSDEFKRFLNQIRSGGQYLNLILTNLLDFTAAEAGRTPLHWSLLRVCEWFSSVRDLLDPIAANHGVRLEWTLVAEDDPVIQTDQVRLTQILLNLVHNAIKFTPRGRRVMVTLRVGGERCELEVADEGPGIPPKDLEIIFEAFRQSDSAAFAAERGVGLGLAVAKANADLLGGSIHILNRCGGGALFTLILPIGPIA
jgi:Signal transduction histidine kinase